MICPYFLHFNRFCFNYAIIFATVVSICNEKGQRGHRDRGKENAFDAPLLGIDRIVLEDFLKRICGLTEPLL